MKKASDPRHKNRQYLIKQLFSHSFNPLKTPQPHVQDILNNLQEIDQRITTNAPEWPISQINKIDLAILRLAVYELQNTQTPPKVIIDEAVELGKEFGSSSSAKFINGVLGNILKQLDKNK